MERMKMEKRATVTASSEGLTITATADLDANQITGPVMVELPAGAFTASANGIAIAPELLERAGAMLGLMRRWKVGDASDLCAWHGYYQSRKAHKYECPRCAAEKEAEEAANLAGEPEPAPLSPLGQEIAAIARGHAELVRAQLGVRETNGAATPALETVE